MARLFGGLLVVLLAASVISAEEPADAKEAIRKELLKRFEQQERIHVAYATTSSAGEGTAEYFREGKLHGLRTRTLEDHELVERWYVTDGQLLAMIQDGEVTQAEWGPEMWRAAHAAMQPVLDELGKEWELPALSLHAPQIYVDLAIEEKEGGAASIRSLIRLTSDARAAWLWRPVFDAMEVAVEKEKNQVVLTHPRLRIVIDRATGLLVSTRAESDPSNTRIVRAAPELAADAWPTKIRSILAMPEVRAFGLLEARTLRASLLFHGLNAIAKASPATVLDSDRLREATERIAKVVLENASASAEVAMLVEYERDLAPSLALVRKTVVESWIEPVAWFRENGGQFGTDALFCRLICDAIQDALRRYAERHLDAALPAPVEEPLDPKTEAIRKELLRRFDEQKLVHVAYTMTLTPGSDNSVAPMSVAIEIFRDGERSGLSQHYGDGTVAWFAQNTTLLVSVVNGNVSTALRGAEAANALTDRVQSEVDKLCDEWGFAAPSLKRAHNLVKVVVDEIEDDRVRFKCGLGIGPGDSASWLKKKHFAKKEVRIDTEHDQVVLTSKRAEMRIDRATGLPISARAHKLGTGGEVRLVRRAVNMSAKTWPLKIRSIVATPSADALAATDRQFRAFEFHLGVREIIDLLPESQRVRSRIAEASERIAKVTLDTEPARLDIKALIEREREAAASRTTARQAVARAWLESVKTLRGEPDDKPDYRELELVANTESVVRRYAEKHFDALWPREDSEK